MEYDVHVSQRAESLGAARATLRRAPVEAEAEAQVPLFVLVLVLLTLTVTASAIANYYLFEDYFFL